MARLNEQLKYFINQKLATDPAWQKVEIILSGHEVRDNWFCIVCGCVFQVPGEGEHKIMDYIRYCKSQPDYDSNTRHCLYGLDADLVSERERERESVSDLYFLSDHVRFSDS